jgi:V8-like Glu-specific endopeptidase
MPPNDVVRRDLQTTTQLDFKDEIEPMPMPLVHQPMAVAVQGPPETTQITEPEINTAPYRSVGRMALTCKNRQNLSGSGWVIARRAFMTAGHCVYDRERGGWIVKASFCPRFNVDCAGKTYTVETAFTLRGFLDNFNEADRQYDLAVCVVTEPFEATEPPLPFVANPTPPSRYAAIGYPGKPIPEYQFNDKRMWRSSGKLLLADKMLFAENNLTTGASGGPWCAPEENWVVRGITAARVTPNPNTAVSPLFAQGFQNLYDAIKDL